METSSAMLLETFNELEDQPQAGPQVAVPAAPAIQPQAAS